MPEQVKRTERGWRGHYTYLGKLLFQRNTLLEYDEGFKVVVSTVGGREVDGEPGIVMMSRVNGTYFETVVFHVAGGTPKYPWIDADPNEPVQSIKPIVIGQEEYDRLGRKCDILANNNHEAMVDRVTQMLLEYKIPIG